MAAVAPDVTQSDAILLAAAINAIVVVGGFLVNHFTRRAESHAERALILEQTQEQTKHIDKEIELTRLKLELAALEAASAAKQAYHEANNANVKIVQLQTQLEAHTTPPVAPTTES